MHYLLTIFLLLSMQSLYAADKDDFAADKDSSGTTTTTGETTGDSTTGTPTTTEIPVDDETPETPTTAEGGTTTTTSSGTFGEDKGTTDTGKDDSTTGTPTTTEIPVDDETPETPTTAEGDTTTTSGTFDKDDSTTEMPELANLSGLKLDGNEATDSNSPKLRGGIAISNGSNFVQTVDNATPVTPVTIKGEIETSRDISKVFVVAFTVEENKLAAGEGYDTTCDGSKADGQYYIMLNPAKDISTANISWYTPLSPVARQTKASIDIINPYLNFTEWNGEATHLLDNPYLTSPESSGGVVSIPMLENVIFEHPGKMCLTIAYQYEGDENLYFSTDTINLTVVKEADDSTIITK